MLQSGRWLGWIEVLFTQWNVLHLKFILVHLLLSCPLKLVQNNELLLCIDLKQLFSSICRQYLNTSYKKDVSINLVVEREHHVDTNSKPLWECINNFIHLNEYCGGYKKTISDMQFEDMWPEFRRLRKVWWLSFANMIINLRSDMQLSYQPSTCLKKTFCGIVSSNGSWLLILGMVGLDFIFYVTNSLNYDTCIHNTSLPVSWTTDTDAVHW